VAAMAAAVEPGPPRNGAASGYTAAVVSTMALGSVRFEVDHRAPGPTGGPTLRVRAAADGRELLRFDCFARGAHWHLDPGGRDEVHELAPGVDALAWTLDALRSELPGYLARAGHAAPLGADAAAQAAALEHVEAELRNPPPDFDALDVAVLRQRGGEKWRTYPEDVLPLWVADQDYAVADPIRRVLQRALDLSDLGYPLHPAPTPLPEVFAARAARGYGWQVAPSRVELLTDVVQGIYVALARLSEPGEGAIVQTPIYPPFLGAVRSVDRTLLENPLVLGAEGFEVDLDGLRRHAARGARILLLCHPHNPTGRVFRRAELEALAEAALAHDLWIVSDEIHADLVYPGARHVPIAALAPEVEARTVTLTSASKAFNVAGLRCALAVFGSDELQKRFTGLPRHLRGGLGSLGIEATLAAFRHADPWLARALAYLEANRDYVADFVARELPGVEHHPPEATYLAWLDFRSLELSPSPYRFFLERAKVALSDGAAFGPPGRGFARLNFATSRAILRDALERMAQALRTR
jgi:cysteine-S-conjugate beta-lyase